ncbi:MAG: hydroxyphenylacetyl-CoA thioesterase PaaI [Vampirovibrio sp.]|nr:hydroxyphenylacetyl-CoA thioesterase PaaI [Vampirovibrio sp.]
MTSETKASQTNQDLATACGQQMYNRDQAAQHMGIVVDGLAPGYAKLHMEIKPTMLSGHNFGHGGVTFLLADTAFAYACNSHNVANVAHTCTITFSRPVNLGDTLTAVAQEAYKASKTGLYDVEITNQQGKTVAYFRGHSYSLNRPVLESSDA